MNKATFFLVLACGVWFLVNPFAASAAVQNLYGKNIEPHSEARRQAAILANQKFRKDRDRSLFGYSNGMLVQEIQQQLEPYSVTPELTAAIEEWLDGYPKIPSGSQRFLARHALSIANIIKQRLSATSTSHRMFGPQQPAMGEAEKTQLLELANRMISEVSNAAKNNHWLPSPKLDSQYTNAALEADLNFEKTLSETEHLIDACRAGAKFKTEKLLPKPRQVSSWPNFIASISNPDGSLKEEEVATQPKDIRLSTFAPTDSARLVKLLDALSKSYPKLPDSSKEAFAGRVFGCTKELQYSNLQSETAALFWKVFDSIDPTWLEHNEIESQLQDNASYYSLKEKPNAVRVYKKVMELEDMFNGGLAYETNLRWVLGDLYDQLGEYKRSKEQYEIAREINERLVSSGLIEADESMERDYLIRMGPPKEIQAKDKTKSVLYPTCD